MAKILDINSQPAAFVKIKIDWASHRDRLSRTILVKKDMPLTQLAYVIGTSVGCNFEHLYEFHSYSNYKLYTNDPFYHDEQKVLNHSLSDLGSKFRFTYDFGDDWNFDCKVYKKEQAMDTDKSAIVLEGVGQGIWEDNRYTLEAYIDGDIDAECTEENEEMGYYKPYNFEIDKFGDFDNPIDCEKLTEEINIGLLNDDYIGIAGADASDFLDYDEDEFYDEFDEDDEFEDELDDVVSDINEVFARFFTLHVMSNPFVEEKIRKLSKKHGEDEATEKVFEVFCNHISNVICGDEPYSLEQYKKDIQSIK